MAREVIRTRNFVEEAAEFILRQADRALEDRGEFRIALSGGNTPRPVYHRIGASARQLPWNKVILTFGDERCVPPDDDQSNYRMANETLLRPAGVPDSSVLRMRGEIEPAPAADQYQEQLDRLAAKRGEQIYQHDLILLGLGEDGHTASLFPDTAALSEAGRRVVANYVAKLDSWRLTVTFPLILAAREVCFLAKKRADLIDRVFSGEESLPATRVDRNAQHVTWILQEDE